MGTFDQFFQEYGITDEAEQRTMASICLGMLMAPKEEPHDIEDIMNSTKLLDEKKAVVALYMKNKDNPKWLGREIFRVQRTILDWIDQKMDGKDLADPTVRSDMLSKIRPAIGVLGYTYSDWLKPHVCDFSEKDDDYGRGMKGSPLPGYFLAAKVAAMAANTPPEKVYAATIDMVNDTKNRVKDVVGLYHLLTRVDYFKGKQPENTNEYGVQSRLAEQMAIPWILQNYLKDSKEPFSKSCPTKEIIDMVCEKIEKAAEKVGFYDFADAVGKIVQSYVHPSKLAEQMTVNIKTETKYNPLLETWFLNDKNEKCYYWNICAKHSIPSEVSVEWPLEFTKKMVAEVEKWTDPSTTNKPAMQPKGGGGFVPKK